MQAKDCGWCSTPETGSNYNRLDNWIKSSKKKTSERQQWPFLQHSFEKWQPWKKEDWEIEENVIRVTTKTMEPIKLSVELDVTQARGPLNEYHSKHKKGHPKDAIELDLTSQR